MTKYEKHGALHVNAKGKLVDHLGETVVLHGYSSHDLSWYPQYINRDTFEFMSENWHIDLVRLAMYTAEEDGYCVSDEENKNKLLDLIDKGVRAATELGLYVIIDWHILKDSDPLMHLDEAVKFWDYISAKYASYGNIFYEICNEPNVEADWGKIRTYAEKIIPIIRKNDAYAVILVGTPTWSQDVDMPMADPLTIDKNLMYVLHFYADTHRDELRDKMEKAAMAGLPLFITEFGICNAAGGGENNYEQGDIWLKLADKYDISYAMWALSNRDETCASFVPDCLKLSDFDENDLRDCAKWYINVLKEHYLPVG